MDTTNRNTALASAICEELARAGVVNAVISPGSRSTPLALAFHRHPAIEVSVVIDERSAGFLALGAAAAGRTPVVLLCTSGTAAANFHPAVCEADLSGVPLIVITADRPPELRDIGAGQTIDQLKLFGSAVRWFCEAGTHDADDKGLLHFRSVACRAVATAAGDPRPGPVHLNIAFRDPLDPAPAPGAVTASTELALNGRDRKPLTSVSARSNRPSSDLVTELAVEIRASRRGLIVGGRQSASGLREPLTELALRAGYPILAEPTSQLRLGPHDGSMISWRYDEIVTDEQAARELSPDLVIRIGELPTSKALRQWLAGLERARQIVIDDGHAWGEPTRIADRFVRADPAILAAEISRYLGDGDGLNRSYAESWLSEDRHRADRFTEQIATEPKLTAATLHHALSSNYRDGDLVYTASSLPIREQEWYLPPDSADVAFLANRGANGIDGLISAGIGACLESDRPTVVITGDVALLHDLGGLASWRLARAPLRILVINNGGGGIFDLLPQRQTMSGQEFDQLMTTPTGIEVERAAALFDLPYHRVEDLDGLRTALDAGTGLIEARVPPPSAEPD